MSTFESAVSDIRLFIHSLMVVNVVLWKRKSCYNRFATYSCMVFMHVCSFWKIHFVSEHNVCADCQGNVHVNYDHSTQFSACVHLFINATFYSFTVLMLMQARKLKEFTKPWKFVENTICSHATTACFNKADTNNNKKKKQPGGKNKGIFGKFLNVL